MKRVLQRMVLIVNSHVRNDCVARIMQINFLLQPERIEAAVNIPLKQCLIVYLVGCLMENLPIGLVLELGVFRYSLDRFPASGLILHIP